MKGCIGQGGHQRAAEGVGSVTDQQAHARVMCDFQWGHFSGMEGYGESRR